MTKSIIVDTGPLVAYINPRDKYHPWTVEQFKALRPPFITNDVVIGEACHLLRSTSEGSAPILAMLSRRLLSGPFRLEEHADAIAKLISRYTNVSMDLADACLVRMTELVEDPLVVTLDGDFLIYRRHGRQRIPTLMPPR